ncbi:MAG: AbrB/MazE/SpoVT family DNA-binding domain-containing protein [Caldilineales bacterium]|nr:AbrB/MazE/SpoVT family DNA-binding domain-containing protein [Caldilineales bacterium]MCW5860059.1 AbrB/MazE/SpoVT family DNA-binding domain-containing protein [Caldilineales bacterium]
MAVVTVSKQGRIAIPVDLRQKYGWRPGTRLVYVDYGGVLTLVAAPKNAIAEAAGMLKGDSSLTQSLRKDRKQ